jgi:predicted nucleic acid-binding protein
LSLFSIAQIDIIVGRTSALGGFKSRSWSASPVLSEAMFLLRDHARGQDILLELVERGALNIAFQMEEHIGTLRSLLRKYRDLPMSLADACLVRMAEIDERYAVLTLDSDFSVYRKHGRLPLMLIHPTIQ